MIHWLLENEPFFRLGMFGGLLAIFMLWEASRPAMPLKEGRRRRWLANFGLVFLGAGVVRLVAPIGAVALAAYTGEEGIGLLNQVDLPSVASVALAMIALDLVIYLQHRLFHSVPVLWRFHRVHHADRDYDVSTALRFHPMEILVSLGIKLGAVYLLGAPVLSVILFEVVLNGAAMFNHANITFGNTADRLLRLVIVTPDMHRVHHSIRESETNSNYGFNLPWWDRFFGTYLLDSEDGKDGVTIGLREHQKKSHGLVSLLSMPFR